MKPFKQGIKWSPVLLGPLSYLYLGKEGRRELTAWLVLPACWPPAKQILAKLAKLGVEWVQIDEAILALELEKQWADSFKPGAQVIQGSDCY